MSSQTPQLPADVAGGTPPGNAGLSWFDANPGWRVFDLRELWTYRELGLVFAVRDLKVRYRQAVVGVLWALLQPLVTMLVFYVLFDLLGQQPTSRDVPYAISAFCGLLPWQLFAMALRDGSQSLVTNRDLVTKVYFPRTLLPLATVVCGLVDFLIGFALLVGLMAFYGVVPGVRVVALPLFMLLTLVLSFGAALWLSALNALYRDIGYVVPFVIQIGFLVSPVVYETGHLIPPGWWGYGLNPMVVVIEGMRWALVGTEMPSPLTLGLSLGMGGVLLVTGLLYFRRVENWIADRI